MPLGNAGLIKNVSASGILGMPSMLKVAPAGNASDSLIAALPSLARWYKANTIAVANGASVTSWLDSSTAGKNATVSNAYPTFATNATPNGKPAVSFNGANQYIAGNGFAYTNGLCATTVFKYSSSGRIVCFNATGTDYNDTDGGILILAQSSNVSAYLEGTNTATPGGTASTNTWLIVTTKYEYVSSSNTNLVLRINGVEQARTNVGVAATGTPILFNMGSDLTPIQQSFTACLIAETLLCVTNITDTQIHSVEQALGAKYGITVA